MDHEVSPTFIVTVEFDEVVASTERTDRLVDSLLVFEFPVATKLRHKFLGLPVKFHRFSRERFEAELAFTYNLSRGYIPPDMLVEGMKVDIVIQFEFQHPHAATYVDAYDVGNYLVP